MHRRWTGVLGSKTEELLWVTGNTRPVYSLRKTCAQTPASSADPAKKRALTHTQDGSAAQNPLPMHSPVHTNSPAVSTWFQSENGQLSTQSTVSIKTIYVYKERKDK